MVAAPANLKVKPNAMTKSTLSPNSIALALILDVANWRPIKGDEFAFAVSQLALTMPPTQRVEFTQEQLPDGRLRLVGYGYVKPQPFEGETAYEPALMVICDLETGKPVAFERTDVDLAVVEG